MQFLPINITIFPMGKCLEDMMNHCGTTRWAGSLTFFPLGVFYNYVKPEILFHLSRNSGQRSWTMGAPIIQKIQPNTMQNLQLYLHGDDKEGLLFWCYWTQVKYPARLSWELYNTIIRYSENEVAHIYSKLVITITGKSIQFRGL